MIPDAGMGHTASRSRVSGSPRAAGMRHRSGVAALRVTATGSSRETSLPGQERNGAEHHAYHQ